MVKYGDTYYDILGPTKNLDLYAHEWEKRNMLGPGHTFIIRPMNDVLELELDQYSEEDSVEAENFIPKYLNVFID